MTRIVDFDELFPGRFIKASDLKGVERTLTIADVDVEDLPSDKGDKVKGIIKFREAKKALVLNRTNGEYIKAMFGRKVPEWIGKRITIFPAEWNGEPCVRIKGSPDLAAPVTFELKLPRKKPKPMTLVVTGRASGKAPPPVESSPEEKALEDAAAVAAAEDVPY